MVRFSVLFLVLSIAAGIYAIANPGVIANVTVFCTVTVLYLSLLGSKRTA